MAYHVCIHGHFYQPPRQNPWLELVEVQDSAAPFHDWNQRVTAECYAPNAAARILGPRGAIECIVNNYERISFNFGPTLLQWLEPGAPQVLEALRRADRLSIERLGHGNAMAQVYNHLIMPLATRRDKLTQVRWGLADFRHRFGRPAAGMWLAETAVDTETLELMAGEGIEFVVLSPEQALAVRGPGETDWQPVEDGGINTGRPYRVDLPGGGTMAVFFYHAELSRQVAFGDLLGDGARFARRIRQALDHGDGQDRLVNIATDGESYGHHHRFGEMALAFALAKLEQDPEVSITNFAAFLADHPPAFSVRIKENSSWSCPHGVERWRSDCGCALDPGSGWSQAWRTPLRQGIDRLGERLAGQFESLGGDLLADPWAARDDYVGLLLDSSPRARDEFLQRHARRHLQRRQEIRVWQLLECQRWSLYMQTSCAWFFDDISGIEAVQNLRFAARALQLAEELGAGPWRRELIDTLAQAKSNLPRQGDGAAVWRARVEPAQLGLSRVAAHAAISGVMQEKPPPQRLYCYRLASLGHARRENLGLELAWGRLKISHQRIGQETVLDYAALHAGGHDFAAWTAPAHGEPREPGPEALELLRRLDPQALTRHLDQRYHGRRYRLGDLFLDGRRRLARQVLSRTLAEHAATARHIFESNRELMRFLVSINVPLPRVYAALAEAIISEDLIEALGRGAAGPPPQRLGELAMEARALGLSLSSPALVRAMEQALAHDLGRLAREPSQAAVADHALAVLDLAEALELDLNLWEPQNLYQTLAAETRDLPPAALALGRRLNFAIAPTDEEG